MRSKAFSSKETMSFNLGREPIEILPTDTVRIMSLGNHWLIRTIEKVRILPFQVLE